MSRFHTRHVYIPIDSQQTVARLRVLYKEEDIDVIELKIKKTFKTKAEILRVVEDELHLDIEYGLLVLADIFPELFSNKRFLNRLKKNLV